jgi:tRNA threonylcarbamoyladenosine biosynthesis protein TsaB
MILAIDTATRTASIALYDETGVIGEATWRARENHTTSLMPQLLRLLEMSATSIDRVEVLAVAIGPGSFTGLRIGLSVAKGIALARGLPIVALPTLDGLAQAFAQQLLPIWAVLDAGRGKYAAGRYAVRRDHAKRVGDYVVGDAEQLANAISAETPGEATEPEAGEKISHPEQGHVRVCGEVDATLRSTLLARLRARVVLTDPANSTRRAAYLAELAWQRWQTNRVNDPDTLAPYYIPTASLPQATGHD